MINVVTGHHGLADPSGRKRGRSEFFIPSTSAQRPSGFNDLPQSGIHTLALRDRWISDVIRPAINQSQRASQRHESPQAKSSEGVPPFAVERELRRGVEVAGN
jgi:hypothetical protein